MLARVSRAAANLAVLVAANDLVVGVTGGVHVDGGNGLRRRNRKAGECVPPSYSSRRRLRSSPGADDDADDTGGAPKLKFKTDRGAEDQGGGAGVVAETREDAGAGMWVLSERVSTRVAREFRRDELVLLRSPSEPGRACVRRLMAMPGDLVRHRRGFPERRRLRSGHARPQLDTNNGRRRKAGVVEVVPDGNGWFESDYSDVFRDTSHELGPVPLGLVDGRVLAVLWPPDKMCWIGSSPKPKEEGEKKKKLEKGKAATSAKDAEPSGGQQPESSMPTREGSQT